MKGRNLSQVDFLSVNSWLVANRETAEKLAKTSTLPEFCKYIKKMISIEPSERALAKLLKLNNIEYGSVRTVGTGRPPKIAGEIKETLDQIETKLSELDSKLTTLLSIWNK